MIKKKKDHKFLRGVGRTVPYLCAAALVFGIAHVGSEDKNTAGATSLNMTAMAAGSVSADQLSELYVVASLSSAMDLASTDTVSGNYVSASVLREISQTSTDKIEKPGYVAVADARGVQTYIVREGETMASIASTHGLTTDQIRWSNGLKTTDVSVGQVLSLPSKPGIVYTVRSGDTAATLASRYGSNETEIVAYNDLENKALVVNQKIVLPNGVLPLTERPEYVPVYTYSYYGAASDRQDMRQVWENVTADGGNRMVWGQCTYYSWWWRWKNGNPLPQSGAWGDAKTWHITARQLGLAVDKSPRAGDVFQTPNGWYGHVGVVLRVNDDGSLLVREMNYGYRVNVITESTIPANSVSAFNYIH